MATDRELIVSAKAQLDALDGFEDPETWRRPIQTLVDEIDNHLTQHPDPTPCPDPEPDPDPDPGPEPKPCDCECKEKESSHMGLLVIMVAVAAAVALYVDFSRGPVDFEKTVAALGTGAAVALVLAVLKLAVSKLKS